MLSTSLPFGFRLKTNLRVGPGTTAELPDRLLEWGCRKVGIIVDAGVSANPHAQQLIEALRSRCETVRVEESDAVEPDYDYLDEFRKRIDPEWDVLIGLGGGSILDLTKAVSVLATNLGPAISYRGFDLIKQPGIPVVAIPTTAGTGSEVTPNAVFTHKGEQRKLGINTELYLPRIAYLDPLMTLSCPHSVTISAGVDALVHSVESYVAKGHTPVSRVFSREGFRLVFNTLPRVVEEPDNVEHRMAVQVGAFYAGSALMNAGAGPAGALSYPLGVRFRVPHGLAGGVFLAPVARYNVEHGATEYAGLYELMDGADLSLDETAKSRAFCDRLELLCAQLAIPSRLDVYGVSRADVPMLTEQTFLLKGALDQNPVPFGQDETWALLEEMTEEEA